MEIHFRSVSSGHRKTNPGNSQPNKSKKIIHRRPSPDKEYDAVVVGSGPNGLAAAITMQRAGLSVLLLEAKATIGGGLRSAELTLPGFMHDICSAVHPMAVASPFFQSLPLAEHGLRYLTPEIALAHPAADGTAATLFSSINETAASLGSDGKNYTALIRPLTEIWDAIQDDVLAPLHVPKHPLDMARFAIRALASAEKSAKLFKTEKGKAFWGGLALHAQLPFNYRATSAIGLVLLTAGHKRGWPFAQGGSQSIAQALAAYFISLGGKIECNFLVRSLDQLPSCRSVLFDVTPPQLLEIAGNRLSSLYRWQLGRYKHGMGVFKIDWALAEQIPFTAMHARKAGTIHLGGSFDEMASYEKNSWEGRHADRPPVILAQPTIVDPTRAPAGKHTAWAYCHVPFGSTRDMTQQIEDQVERYAPGFKESILGKYSMNTKEIEAHNPNNAGGDIGGGSNQLSQLFTRPALRMAPYRSSVRGIYLCSSSTPPAGGVHGMCGFHAAKRALRDIFRIGA